MSYRGTVRREFDLDAGLKRRPAILVVDELAHSNLIDGDPPPRHAKRWQDIEELLEQGINVWTTVNVQHLESLNDLVAQITGVRQRETIPDRIFDEADEIELIDLPPDDLLARLKAGKVYVPEQVGDGGRALLPQVEPDRAARAGAAAHRRSRRRRRARVGARGPNLARLDGARPRARRDRSGRQAEQVVRAGKRIADGLDAQWSVVYVETPDLLRLSTAERNRRIDLLRLAESLGAETVTLDGPSAAQALLEYARTRNATRLVIGAPKRRGWRAWLRPSTTLGSGAQGARLRRHHDRCRRRGARAANVARRPMSREAAVRSTGSATRGRSRRRAICTAVAFAMYPYFELANIVMAYVLGSTIAGVRFGRGPAIVAAIANVLAFDFCFVPPRFTFSVADAQYLVTFAVMLIVTLVIANLMASVRQQTRVAGARERRTALLYAMSRELAATRGVANMARVAVRHVAEVFDCKAVVLLPDANRRLHYPDEPPIEGSFQGADLSIAQWVVDHGRRAGLGSDTLPAAPALYVPLSDERQRLGVLAVLPSNRAAQFCCRSSVTCSRRLPGSSVWRWSARSSPSRRRRRASRPRPKACATRCSRRSRTTCERRWR